MRHLAWIACVVVFASCGKEQAAETSGEEAPSPHQAAAQLIDIDDPQTCAPCHGTIVAEWSESMHARAHHDRDPIYAGVRALRMKKEGDQVAGACAVCHTPRFAGELDGLAARQGVGCASCHAVAKVKATHEGPGATRMIWTGGTTLLGPHDLVDAGEGAPHGTGSAPAHMKDGMTLCLTCHDTMKSPKGVAMCNTGPEHASVEVAGGDTCVSCHMPEVKGASGVAAAGRATHRSHQFAGPHRAWYQDDNTPLRDAMDLAARLDGDGLIVTLTNRSGHSVPTGFAGRLALVTATGSDATGKPVWRSAPTAPMKETPQAVLNKVYVDAEGQPTLAPWAEKIGRDTRLKPGESREIRLTGVPAEVATVEVALQFRLLPSKLAKKLGLTGKLEDETRTARTVTVAR